MKNAKIFFDNVSKAFGEKVVLKNLSLNIMPKESYVIIGPSGAGKSVLLKTLLGFIPLDSGAIYVDGEDVTRFSKRKRQHFFEKVSIVFQGSALFDSLPIWENVAFGLINGQNMPRNIAREKATQAIKKVGLHENVLDLLPSELSGGMQKRVAFARGIVMEPEILLFDEPTAGLDPVMTTLISEVIASLQKELNITTLTITHDMRCVSHIADRVGLLIDGAILWEGTVKELEKSTHPHVKQFVKGLLTGPLTEGAV